MIQIQTAPAPGDMTVPPLSGWEQVALVLGLLVVLVVAVSVVAAARAGRAGQPEWQAWLDARSRRPDGDAQDAVEEPAR